MKKLLLISLLFFFGFAVVAQTPCGNDIIYKQEIKNNPDILLRQKFFNQKAEQRATKTIKKSGAVQIIPIVFHIIHNAGTSNISDAQVFDAIDILNKDFRRLNTDAVNTREVFKGAAADMEIEFRLARKDPNGNCTNGIVRIFDEETTNGSDSIKKKSYWPSDKYLNIWVVESIIRGSGALGFMGYTQYPWTDRKETDGIMLINRGVGSIGTSRLISSKNLTHEAGHWLGCLHTFTDGCSAGDFVADTPPCDERFSIISCDTTKNTCIANTPDLPDQIENYMDFSVGTCQNMFTIGQKSRMETTLYNFRTLVSKSQNLIATGTDKVTTPANCAPIADFITVDNQSTRLQSICTNTAIEFKDISYNYTGAISYQWTFEGGAPSTSTQKNPTVSFAQAGKFDVTLIVSNTNGTDTLELKDYITVTASTANTFAPFVQDFESIDFANSDWTLNSNFETNFSITNVGAGSVIPNNANALFIDNSKDIQGSSFNLNSPAFNFTAISNPVLSFYYAATQRPINNFFTQDAFNIYFSSNCGQDWQLLWKRSGNSLSTLTTPGVSSPFFPSDATKWEKITVPLIPTIPTSQLNNIRFKFQFTSGGGNNFFLDGINIGFPTSINEMDNLVGQDFLVYPNPNNGSFSVGLNLKRKSKVKITLIDALGRQITSIASGLYNAGDYNFNFNSASNKIKSGVYYISLSNNGSTRYKKIIITTL